MKHRSFTVVGVVPAVITTSLALVLGCSHAAPSAPVVQGANPLAKTVEKPIPPNGKPMVPGDANAALTFSGSAQQGSGATVPVTGQRFTTARRFTVLVKPENPWALQAVVASPGTVKKGDVLLAAFYIRAEKGQRETGEARTMFVWEKQGEPWTKYSELEVSAGKEWKRVLVPITMTQDVPPETHVTLRLGYGEQIIEIADFQFLNFGDSVKISDLPRTRAVYRGIEANAAWRKEAQARIEKIRKGDVSVTVKNAAGKIMPNANVTLAQTRHAFGFGTAVSDAMISAQTPDGDKYREWVKKYCSKVVIENDLKWENFEPHPQSAKRVVGWLNANKIPVKGHNLVWGSYRYMPKDVRDIGKDKVKLAKRVNDHITQEVTAVKGQIVEWDVINEPWDNHDLTDVLGKEAMVDWFKLTKSLDPKPRLTLNDYPKLGESADIVHMNHFYDTIAFLQKQKAPLESIGFQGHFGGSMVAPEAVLKDLTRFDTFGLPITITEFDINTSDRELQAAYMGDFMTAAFSHPSVDTFIMWGFWEKAHWLPDAALFNTDWTIRPHGAVFQDLVRKTWWTNATGVTGNKGTWQGRGFYGDYDVSVTLPNGAKKTVPAKIAKGAKNAIVVTM